MNNESGGSLYTLSYTTSRVALRVLGALCLNLSLNCGLIEAAQRDSNEIFLSWIDGPASTFNSHSANKRPLSISTGSDRLTLRSLKYGLLIDSRRLDIPRMTLSPPAGDAATPLDPTLPDSDWEESKLKLTAEIDGQRCTAQMTALTNSAKSPKDRTLEYPVRVIESGNYFNHLAMYGIEWVAENGKVHLGRGHLELRAWGDRVVLECTLEAAGKFPSNALRNVELTWKIPQLKFSQRTRVERINPDKSATLRLGCRVNEQSIQPWVPEPGNLRVHCPDETNTATWNRAAGCWEIQLEKPPRLKAGPSSYAADLDRVTEVPFFIENQEDHAVDVPVRWIHPRHPIVGFVLMLLDDQGRPTGIPVQTSKNWHRIKDHPLPHEGPWIHGSARINVPPRSTRQLRYVIVHTRWQGVPAASAAQLSLVGWGHNGFWTQMALGSWGEHVCIQPGRLMRRSFLTDLRPFLTLNEKTRKPWGWSSNVGGCDTMLMIDQKGRYLPWGGVVSDFVANGPNLVQVRTRERAADGSLALQTDTYLPRSDDILRVYLDVRLRVTKDVDFSRFALFQLGADYYNSNNSTALSYGASDNLHQSETPRSGRWEYVLPPQRLNGDHPWVTLTGNTADGVRDLGGGTRGLIVRRFDAVLDGKKIARPWIAGYNGQLGKLNAEIVPPPSVKKLRSGDSVDMQLELIVLPLNAGDYYGDDRALVGQLESNADTWKMTAWEAAGNDQRISVDGAPASTAWPLTISADNRDSFRFEVLGGSGLIPLRISGLQSPQNWQVLETTDGSNKALGKRHSEESNPQVEFDRFTGTWTATLSLRPPQRSSERAVRKFQWVRKLSQQ